MNGNPVTITVSDELLKRAREIAKRTSQPVEQVLVQQLEEGLSDLPSLLPDEQAELEALAHLSDDALWTIAREQMPEARQERMQQLMDRNDSGKLTDAEKEELEQRIASTDRLTLRKAQASALLARRGHAVTPDSLTGRDASA